MPMIDTGTVGLLMTFAVLILQAFQSYQHTKLQLGLANLKIYMHENFEMKRKD